MNNEVGRGQQQQWSGGQIAGENGRTQKRKNNKSVKNMSEHCEENLLDEDLGDEEYELGNDEEEALLADDYEIETQSSYKGEEEPDDVLDLGVTDQLDDLEGDEENINYSGATGNIRNHNNYYEERHDSDVVYYTRHEYEENHGGESHENVGNSPNKPDLREKLTKNNAQKDFYVGNGQGMEDDDCEEAKERRNRFQNERTIISPKMNHEIPDSLENVVTMEQSRPSFRGRGRGRGIRGIRGGRFVVPQNVQNFAPRFNGPRGPVQFENQRPPFRPPLLENRPPYPGPRLNIPNNQQQIPPFPQNNPQMGPPPPYGQFPMNGPPQVRPQFMESRPPFNPNQFQGHLGPPGPRLMGPRPDFDPRGGPPLLGPGPPPQNYPPNAQPQFQIHNQQAHFQNQGNQGPPPLAPPPQQPPMQGNRGPMIGGNQGPPIRSQMQGNQGPPLIRNPGVMMQQQQGHLRPPGMHNQITVAMQNHPNAQNISFDNQNIPPPYHQGQHFPQENPRPVYDSRGVYTDQNQYNNGPPPITPSPSSGPPSLPPSPTTGNVPNPLPPGHKILINPHFRGAVQPTTDARLVWDSNIQPQQQQPPPQSQQPSQIPNEQFLQQQPGQFQDQRPPYNQRPSSAQPQLQPQQEYTQTNIPQNKSDDPYAYFSDVWQENKTQKAPLNAVVSSNNSSSTFNNEINNYNYNNEFDNNYKTQNQWDLRDNNYQTCYSQINRDTMDYSDQGQQQREQQQSSYRDRDIHSRSSNIDRPRESRITSTNSNSSSNSNYRNENYDQNRPQRTPSNRSSAPTTSRGSNNSNNNRSQQKRSQEGYSDRGGGGGGGQRGEDNIVNPKRLKLNNRNLHEVRTIDHFSDSASEKKVYENEDPEMREYRKKLEEQKRMREKFLREKENRRKIAAMEKQYDKDKAENNSAGGESSIQDTKPVSVVTGVTKDVKVRQNVGRGRSRPVSSGGGSQSTEGSTERPSGLRIVRTIQTVQPSTMLTNADQKDPASSIPTIQANEASILHKRQQQISSQQGIRRVVIHKALPNTQKVATTIQKTVSNLQKGIVSGLQKTTTTMVKKIPSQQISVNNITQQQQQQKKNLNMNINQNQKVIVNTQNNQRIVLQKTPPQMRKLNEIKTNIIKIENLAASTTENQIRRMCQGIGTLESIRMSEGSATIVFKTQSAALVFHKKYQRKMLDLSLINVHLVPQSGTISKANPMVVKKS